MPLKHDGLSLSFGVRPLPMRDPYTPAGEDLERWAYDEDAPEPVQDWDIVALKDSGLRPAMMRFVKDPECPKRRYFLHVLYLTAGDLLRSRALSEDIRDAELNALEGDLRNAGAYSLYRLAERIAQLRASGGEVEYRLWCASGYADQEETV